ncbi:hypothetical protein V6N13_079929 [Hibiscus sabdariffa]
MGALDYIANFCTVTGTRSKHKPMQVHLLPLSSLVCKSKIFKDGECVFTAQTVKIKVKMDCDGCERRVRNAIYFIEGIKTVEVNRNQSLVTVTGNVDPNKVLKKVKSTGKNAEFWPYIPQQLVPYPHASGAYDKRAPSGFVRNVVQGFPASSNSVPEEYFASLFSDDNVHACSVM